jgi:hypothetical protein
MCSSLQRQVQAGSRIARECEDHLFDEVAVSLKFRLHQAQPLIKIEWDAAQLWNSPMVREYDRLTQCANSLIPSLPHDNATGQELTAAALDHPQPTRRGDARADYGDRPHRHIGV